MSKGSLRSRADKNELVTYGVSPHRQEIERGRNVREEYLPLPDGKRV